MTDTRTHRYTDRQTPAILLSAPCYAIAMGQIKIDVDLFVTTAGTLPQQKISLKIETVESADRNINAAVPCRQLHYLNEYNSQLKITHVLQTDTFEA